MELSLAMLAVARRRVTAVSVAARLCEGDAQALAFPDASFDVVVSTLTLCTIPDDRRAVAEAARVLRPGGRLLLLEHVRSPLAPVRLVQRLLDPLFTRLAGDHLLRDPLDYLGAEGFTVEEADRSRWGLVERLAAHRRGGA